MKITLGPRQFIPVKTAEEMALADAVYQHAITNKHHKPNPSRIVKARLRCNQLAPDNRGVCDWETWIEGRSETIERDSKRVIFEHMKINHPYLTSKIAYSITNNAHVSLVDV